MNPTDIKRKDRKYYFGFGCSGDFPGWQNGIDTSLAKEEVIKDYYYKTNPFVPRLRRIFKEYKDKENINIRLGLTYHDIVVDKKTEIRPLVREITQKLIDAGWQLGDFNSNMAALDIWEEHLEKQSSE